MSSNTCNVKLTKTIFIPPCKSVRFQCTQGHQSIISQQISGSRVTTQSFIQASCTPVYVSDKKKMVIQFCTFPTGSRLITSFFTEPTT
jgi:hypothetical protein